jgi:hypothetical protein
MLAVLAAAEIAAVAAVLIPSPMMVAAAATSLRPAFARVVFNLFPRLLLRSRFDFRRFTLVLR